MPKNKVGGKKHKGKKNTIKESKELVVPEENELIGQVSKVKGNGRFDIRCIDGTEKSGILRGTMRKKVWVNRLDLVLVEPWDFQTEKCSILHKYQDNEMNKLLKGGHLPKEFKIENDSLNLDEEEYFSYDISDSDDEKESSLDEKVNESISSGKEEEEEEKIDLNDI